MERKVEIKFKIPMGYFFGIILGDISLAYLIYLAVSSNFNVDLDSVSSRNRGIFAFLNQSKYLYYIVIVFFICIIVLITYDLFITIMLRIRGVNFIYLKDNNFYILKPHYARIYFKEGLATCHLHYCTKVDKINKIIVYGKSEKSKSFKNYISIGGCKYKNYGKMSYEKYREVLSPHMNSTLFEYKQLVKEK